MKAARIVNVNEPLQIQELQTPKPKGPQILIKVQSVGVCHSDVHVWDGYYEGRFINCGQSCIASWSKKLQTSSLRDSFKRRKN
jgi:NADPH:quinone reductase-like Zn-dependent oxidoreductase